MVKKLLISLDSKTGLGKMKFGTTTVDCGGKVGFAYPAEAMINPSDEGTKQPLHLSREYNNAEMKWSVLWIGQRGVFFHQWANLAGSVGCIHILEGDAKTFYDWVDEKVYVVFKWVVSSDETA